MAAWRLEAITVRKKWTRRSQWWSKGELVAAGEDAVIIRKACRPPCLKQVGSHDGGTPITPKIAALGVDDRAFSGGDAQGNEALRECLRNHTLAVIGKNARIMLRETLLYPPQHFLLFLFRKRRAVFRIQPDDLLMLHQDAALRRRRTRRVAENARSWHVASLQAHSEGRAVRVVSADTAKTH
jgi:hypothetical protein